VTEFLVAAFYKFTTFEDYASMQEPIENCCLKNDVRGIVLLANEGINATIAGPRKGVLAVLEFLRKDPRLSELTAHMLSPKTGTNSLTIRTSS